MSESNEHASVASTRKCPKCRSEMVVVHVGDVSVDRCRSCGGVWLDVHERERLIKAGSVGDADPGNSAQTSSRDGTYLCPEDNSRLIEMTVIGQPHIRYESCKICGGSFFDPGELRDLSEHTLGEKIRGLFRARS